ncbi:hypothetical protein KIPB_011180, partial [Kipferlia bialata]
FAPVDVISNHIMGKRSVRRYKDTPVPRDIIQSCLDITAYCPNGYNARAVGFTVITDRSLIARLGNAVHEAMKGAPLPLVMQHWQQRHGAGEGEEDTVFWGAPCVVFSHYPATWRKGVEDSTIALAAAEMVAVSHGLGTLWLGAARALGTHPSLASLAGVPEGRKVVGGMTFGYPAVRFVREVPREPVPVNWVE